MRLFYAAALVLPLAGVANAHNSWLEPKSFQTAAGAAVPVTFYVGHHGERRSTKLSPRPSWLLSMKMRGGAGTTDLLAPAEARRAAGSMFGTPGSYLLSLDTGDFGNRMSSKKFDSYLEEEGLAAAEAAWRKAPIASRQVRESYRRHAKTLVQVGSGANSLEGPVTQRIGQRLEIVPGTNPYLLRAGSDLPATIWFRDKRLAGARVILSSLDQSTAPPLSARSDASGNVSFTLPGAGRWMMNVVWSVPSSVRSTDFQTSFSSLTFAVPEQE